MSHVNDSGFWLVSKYLGLTRNNNTLVFFILEGEALRDDENFTFVSAWEYKGEPSEAILVKEDLNYEEIEVKTRSYK